MGDRAIVRRGLLAIEREVLSGAFDAGGFLLLLAAGSGAVEHHNSADNHDGGGGGEARECVGNELPAGRCCVSRALSPPASAESLP